ncbi:unnamed protein product, partial [marine sediment metagenome]
TLVNGGVTASIRGHVRSIDIFPNSNLSGCKVGIFYKYKEGWNFKVRSSVGLGNVSAGFSTISGLSLAVEVGDYIGMYYASGAMERSISGEEGLHFEPGDYCDVGDTVYMYRYNGDAISLGGYITPRLSVTIQPLADILPTSATAHGTVTQLGETPCTQHGHCWSTSPSPTIANDKTELGAIASVPHTFESKLTDLSPSTIYYVRAYATDEEGTEYNAEYEKVFRTHNYPAVAVTALYA